MLPNPLRDDEYLSDGDRRYASLHDILRSDYSAMDAQTADQVFSGGEVSRVLARGDYARWLGEEPDPRDLMRPFPADPMRMWPISTRVNKPENDDPSIVEPIEPATDAA